MMSAPKWARNSAPARTSGHNDKEKSSKRLLKKKRKKDKKKKKKSYSSTDSSSSETIATELKSMMLKDHHRFIAITEKTLQDLHPQKLGFLVVGLVEGMTAASVFQLGGNLLVAMQDKLDADPPHLVLLMVRIWELLLSAFRKWRLTPRCT